MTTTEKSTAWPDGALPPAADAARRVHEHGWLIESRHPTSQGWVSYVRCAGCGARRVDLQHGPDLMPAACSATLC